MGFEKTQTFPTTRFFGEMPAEEAMHTNHLVQILRVNENFFCSFGQLQLLTDRSIRVEKTLTRTLAYQLLFSFDHTPLGCNVDFIYQQFPKKLNSISRGINRVVFPFRTMTAGQFLNGLAGPVTQAAPPLLSSAWFPRSERTTATAVASLCGSLGVAFSFLIGPNMVGGVDLDSFPTQSEFSQLTSNYR
jgi:hypothetical protein